MSKSPVIVFSHVHKAYGDFVVMEDINLSIYQGEVVSIIGPSGAGKSTLLRMINMLSAPTSGSILVNGVDVTKEKKNLGKIREKMQMVFQSFNLFSNKDILQNVCLGPIQLLHMDKTQAQKEALALLEKVGLLDKASSYPDELSGGQKQRVAIARALAMHPSIMLFDEPTSALDPTMIGEVLSVIRDLSRDKSLTTLIVTHEMKFAREASSRILFVDDKGIYEDGTPDAIFFHPQKPKTQEFINQNKRFTYKIKTKNPDIYDFNNCLSLYLKDAYSDSQRIERTILFFEELLFDHIAKHSSSIVVTLECQNRGDDIDGNIVYEGNKYDPLIAVDEDDELSILIVKKLADTKLEYKEGSNILSYRLKEKAIEKK